MLEETTLIEKQFILIHDIQSMVLQGPGTMWCSKAAHIMIGSGKRTNREDQGQEIAPKSRLPRVNSLHLCPVSEVSISGLTYWGESPYDTITSEHCSSEEQAFNI